jgi:hypothetical protein
MSTGLEYMYYKCFITLCYLCKTLQAELGLVQTRNNSDYCKEIPKSVSKIIVLIFKLFV